MRHSLAADHRIARLISCPLPAFSRGRARRQSATPTAASIPRATRSYGVSAKTVPALCEPPISRTVKRALYRYQRCDRPNAIAAAPEAMQHSLSATRRDAKNGSAADAAAGMRAAVIRRPVERAAYVDQGRQGTIAIAAAPAAQRFGEALEVARGRRPS
jgi:hypothetical protein